MNPERLSLFSIPIQISVCPFFEEIKEELTAEILNLSNLQKDNIESHVAPMGKINLKESAFNLHDSDSLVLQRLFAWIKQEIESVNNSLTGMNFNCTVKESWYHVTSYGGSHLPHQHPNCSWCCIFYIEPGDGTSGHNMFHSKEYPGYVDEGYFWFSEAWAPKPTSGNLVIFPSLLLHSATPFLENDKQRIVISCNTTVKTIKK